MLQNYKKTLFSAMIVSALTLTASFSAHAEEVKQSYNGMTVNANVVLAEGQTLKDEVVLLTHGTLTHNGRETYSGIQKLLAENGISSVAPNLSLNINDRHGEHDCAVFNTHKHEDAVLEIGFWLNWLKEQGADSVSLMGHSRGGNQTAWYSVENDSDMIKKVILIAPATWSNEAQAESYEKQFGVALQPILDNAEALVKAGKGDTKLTKTNFIYCENADVSAEAFASYYRNDERMDTPTLLKKAVKPTLVIIGSADTVVADLSDKMEALKNPLVQHVTLEGADHFFLDLSAEELVDESVTFIKE